MTDRALVLGGGGITGIAVDAHTVEFVVFDRDAGAPVVEAVAASCAVPGIWPPVTTAGRRFIGGGVRSPVDADLAAGFRRVVVPEEKASRTSCGGSGHW